MSLLIQDAAGPESRILFGAILLAVALERMWELLLSRRNVRAAMARGGMEAGRRLYPWMVTLHGSFLVSCVLEIL
ncbi:MAG: hypothetical protein ACE5ID_11170, partial [Acidobacteriota bacterium]